MPSTPPPFSPAWWRLAAADARAQARRAYECGDERLGDEWQTNSLAWELEAEELEGRPA